MKQAPLSQQELNTGRVDLTAEDYIKLIGQRGLRLTHETATFCSCREELNGGGEPDCVNCKGSGYVFLNPREVEGVIQSIGYNPKFMNYSEVNGGTATLTMPYDERVGWFDRFTLLDGSSIFMENIYPILRKYDGINENLSALLTYKPNDILSVFLYMGKNIAQKELFEFEEDGSTPKDFSYSGNIFILSDDLFESHKLEGDAKAMISIRYAHNPQYIVMDIPNDIRNTRNVGIGGVEEVHNLPIKCIIKKAHHIIGGSGFGDAAKPA